MRAIIVPYPDNPAHAANLRSIPLLEAQGFVGTDRDLGISVHEYGFAWRYIDPTPEDPSDIVFLHRISNREETVFDRVSMWSGTDVRKEWDWADWPSLMDYLGSSDDEWDKEPFHLKVYDLFTFYGSENVFGSSYWEGIKIRDTENESPADWLWEALKPFADLIEDPVAFRKNNGGEDLTSMVVSIDEIINARNILAETALIQ